MGTKILNRSVSFPVGINLDDFVHTYKSLFDAHGVPNVLPLLKHAKTINDWEDDRRDSILREFANMNGDLIAMKNDYLGEVSVVDMTIIGDRALIKFKVGSEHGPNINPRKLGRILQ